MHNKKNIASLKIGENARISEFSDSLIAAKLMAMGLLPGTSVSLLHKAPFGGAFYVKSNQHFVALRKNEAEHVIVNELKVSSES